MSDIVERLRDSDTTRRIGESYADVHDRRQADRNEAADEITRLTAENEKLRAALLPFASIKADVGDGFIGSPDMVIIRIEASVRELKAARAALEEK